MNSKTYFRELCVPNDRSAPLAQIDWWWGLVAAIVMLALFGVAHQLDERSQRALDAHTAAQALEQRVRSSMLPNIRAAYEQGQRDALAAAAPDASGLQIASTCMAWWYDTGTNKRAMRERVCGRRP